jgi:hypothetical protein
MGYLTRLSVDLPETSSKPRYDYRHVPCSLETKVGNVSAPLRIDISEVFVPAISPKPCGGLVRTPVRDPVMIRAEKKLAKIRREIVQRDKRLRRALHCIELAIERITTGMTIAEIATRHNLTQSKVRRDIETAIFLARSRMFEKTPSTLTSLNESRQLGR